MKRRTGYRFFATTALIVTSALAETDAYESDRQWWAFQPLTPADVPVIEGDNWSRNPIDRFVYRQLAEREMKPADPADEITLVRRLYFDLIGLPPSPEQIDEFVNHSSDKAWESLVDRLLADPRYGEHWARFWLDVVRYSESDGWNQDAFRPDIWRYRDYVVNSFNGDKPYTTFVREQLAGDEMPGDNPENRVATGFLRLGIYEYNQRDAVSHWNDIMNEITDVTGDVFLGLGVACARCHDHKFDPLPQTDYFKLRSFFEPLVWRDDLTWASAPKMAAYQEQLAIWEEASKEIRTRIDTLIKPYYDRKWKSTVDKFPLNIQACFNKPVAQRTSWEDQMAYLVDRQFYEEGGGPLQNMTKEDKKTYDALKKELASFDGLKPAPLPPLMTVTDFPGPAAPTVIPKDPERRPIEPGFLTVLASLTKSSTLTFPKTATSSGRRTALSEWIGRPDNPLTTRVIVNRIWRQHFDRGIVRTPNDFGHLGQVPTHPELLDWLTLRFVENNWRLKWLHKQILMSATWRQSAFHPMEAEYQQWDPEEKHLWRSGIRRLNAEQIRDAMLSVSGELEAGLGGPSVDGAAPRRSLYVKSFRNTPNEFLHAFDAANGLKSVPERNNTTTPIQSLLLFNGDYSLARADHLAKRLEQSHFATVNALLNFAFRLTWGRMPTETERVRSRRFLGITAPSSKLDSQQLSDFCHVLLNSNEFLYLH